MAETTARGFPLKYLLFPLGIAVIIFFMSISMARTSTTEFCVSCHEIKTHKKELEKSSHAVDKDKNPIQCYQCHIPSGIGPKYLTVKILLGVKDFLVHNFGDPENLNRREMQKVARRFIPDENCLACHNDLTKNVKDKELSEIGKLCHEAYQGKNGTSKRGCAGCHFNMAHLPKFDRRFFFNTEFAKRLPLKEEQQQ
ncbi:MAG: NapC/NirT family cytochrome c [Desulfobacteraceae bacterium]|nr:NapC/NirT family cytochrome c [Desulfobacteraceae bacterium]